ncbi:MAG TPA: hypothetical protein PLS49_06465 [Candidatus Woesebacteria bacterium]|nr:hypothetical protein [Candidatus Woesebacteria bacterium]
MNINETKLYKEVRNTSLAFLAVAYLYNPQLVEALPKQYPQPAISTPRTLDIDPNCKTDEVTIRWSSGAITQMSSENSIPLTSNILGVAQAIDAYENENTIMDVPQWSVEVGGDCVENGTHTLWSSGAETDLSINEEGYQYFVSSILGIAEQINPATSK